jgi:cAMP phosphodiesterase
MNYIEFLGTSGTKTSLKGTTCLRVSTTCVIDAGNLIEGTAQELFLIEHIFLTHSHLDHIVDIAFMADLFVSKKKSSLKIYGLKATLNNLRDFVFNHQIWPNFEEINLLEHDAKTIEFIEIHPNERYSIDDIVLTPFKTNHTDGSCGYLIEQDNKGILFTSDTYKCKKIWEIMENYPHIHSLIIDVSFPSAYEKLAHDSKHMTPKILAEELATCKSGSFQETEYIAR